VEIAESPLVLDTPQIEILEKIFYCFFSCPTGKWKKVGVIITGRRDRSGRSSVE
jgi:hypothetical protein